MAGLYSNAGALFTFYLIVYTTFLALSSFFRLLGVISFNFDTAARMARFVEFCLAWRLLLDELGPTDLATASYLHLQTTVPW